MSQPSRSMTGAAAVAAVAILIGAVYLLRPVPESQPQLRQGQAGYDVKANGPADSRLAFEQGEVYYASPVTEEAARRLGEYLVEQHYFSDEQGGTVQLHFEQGRYLLRFVVKPEFAEELLTRIQFGLLGGRIARDLFDEQPVELGLSDARLNLIRQVPRAALNRFGKGELYYTEPITGQQAQLLGDYLTEIGFFSNERTLSVLFGREEAYWIKFVTDPSRAQEPGIRSAFRDLGFGVASQVLGWQPLVVHLCDDRFRTLFSERLDPEGERAELR